MREQKVQEYFEGLADQIVWPSLSSVSRCEALLTYISKEVLAYDLEIASLIEATYNTAINTADLSELADQVEAYEIEREGWLMLSGEVMAFSARLRE